MKKLSIYVMALATTFFVGCDSEEKIVEEVIDGITSSAILRTRNLQGNPYNVFVPESALTITVEAQNGRKGTEITSIDLFLSFVDNQDDDVDNNKAEQLITSFTPADFTTGSRGLPEITYNTTLAESAAALGLADGTYSGGDVFNYRYEVNLSDGTSWTNVNGNGNITGGSYFSSPYQYAVSVSCIPTGPIPGTYELKMEDSFGDGWNGASVRVTLDGESTDYNIPDGSSGSATIEVPEATSAWKWEFISGSFDGEVTFEITAPNGEVAFEGGPSPTVGEILLSICPD